MQQVFDIAILGASGYTGAELVRLIATHPSLRIAAPEVKQAALAWVPEAMWFRVLGDTEAGVAEPEEGEGEPQNDVSDPTEPEMAPEAASDDHVEPGAAAPRETVDA